MKNPFKRIIYQRILLFFPVTITVENPLGPETKEVSQIIGEITGWLLRIGAPIVTIMILWGAFQIMSSGGDTEKITKGRQIITWTVVATIILLLSGGIVNIIRTGLGI